MIIIRTQCKGITKTKMKMQNGRAMLAWECGVSMDMRFERVAKVELFDEKGYVFEISCRLPGVVGYWVSFPLNEVVYAIVHQARIEDFFNFIFELIFNYNRRRGWLNTTGNL